MKLEELFLEAKKLNEDGEGGGMAAPAAPAGDVGGGAEASVEVSDNQSGIKDVDVLGKWDPAKGFFGQDNFIIPKNVLGKGKVLRRYEIPSLKKKGQKNPYVKGMEIIEKEIDEGELTSGDIYDIHSMEHDDIVKFLNAADPTAKLVLAIAYYPKSDVYFIKYLGAGKKASFIAAKLNDKKFELTREYGNRLMSLKDVKDAYDIIDTKPSMFVVWGELK